MSGVRRNEQRDLEIVRLRREKKLSYEEIGKLYHISPSRVSSLGVRVRKQKFKDTADEVLQFLIDFKRLHDGNSPVLEEVRVFLGGIAKSNCSRYLWYLNAQGLIKYDGHRIEIPGGKWDLEEKNG